MSQTNMIEGFKVLLRKPTKEDREVFDDIFNDKESMRALIPFFGGSNEWSEDEVSSSYNRFTQNTQSPVEINFAIVQKATSKVVGCCGFKNINPDEKTAEFGIILTRSVWGTGISKDTHLCALNWAFDSLKLSEIFFYTDEHNLRMIGFFEKHGIRFKGTKERMQYFTVTSKEWPSVAQKLMPSS